MQRHEIPSTVFRSKLANNEVMLGCLLPYNAPWLIEMFAITGFDFVVIDLEHEVFNDESVAELIRCADGAGIASVVRMAYSDRANAFLTAGAKGVQIPHIHTGGQAHHVVERLRPFPRGQRTYYMQGRSVGYGLGLHEQSALKGLDEEFVVIAMIESLEAIHHLDEILAVDGIDAIHVGPLDLAQSMNFPPSDDVKKVISKVVSRARDVGKQVSVGVVTPTGLDEMQIWLDEGVRLFTIASAWLLADSIARFYDSINARIPQDLRPPSPKTPHVPHNTYLSGDVMTHRSGEGDTEQ